MKDVVLITVQYNNPTDTEIFLKSVGRLRDHSVCEVVVVDNSTTDSGEEFKNDLADLQVRSMRPPANLYYWGGAAFALELLYGPSGPWPRWVVVCNNDIEIVDEDFLKRLDQLDPATHPIVAPGIVSEVTGKDQNPILDTYPPLLKRLKWRAYDLSYPVARTLLALHKAGRLLGTTTGTATNSHSAPPARRRIYAPHGACMIFSSAFFERGGKLDTEVPLFAEELTIAALAEKLSMPVWYCPDFRVLHREHSTTGLELTREKYEMERMARRRFYSYGE